MSSSPAGASDFFVAGVGASAGGLKALGSLFESMPSDCGMAFVVVQHLSPDHRSHMVELLSRRTRLPVRSAADDVEVKPGKIYVIPPRWNLEIHRGRLLLVPRTPPGALNLPVDAFFRSLAEDLGPRAVGIVLSGAGSDGTRGIRAIKDAGGLVVVQSEDSARFDGMPRSAISTGLADLVLAPEEMPGALLDFVRHPLVARPTFVGREEGVPAGRLRQLFSRLEDRTGVDFSLYKASTIDHRIARRISVKRLGSLDEYEALTQACPAELDELFEDLLIGVTRFFRDPESWDVLAREVLPGLVTDGPPDRPLRIWASACSTGEEAYSLAILLDEALKKAGVRREVTLLATDASERALQVAREGIYTESEVAEISSDRLNRYFRPVREGHRVRSDIREMVSFSRQDLLGDPPPPRIDLVTCRNVLIYLSSPVQRRVLTSFREALRPDGVLFLGASEGLGEASDHFASVSIRHRIFRAQASGRSPRRGAPPAHEPAARPDRVNELLNDVNNLLATSSAGTLLLDEQLRIRRVSPSLKGLLALTERDEGLPIETLAHQLNEPELEALAREAVSEETDREVEVLQPDQRTLLLRMSPYRTETGLVRGLVLTASDITRRRRSEDREDHQVQLTRGVLDSIPAHVAVLDREGTILHVNRPWTEFELANSGPPSRGGSPRDSVSDAGPGSASGSGIGHASATADGPARKPRYGVGANYFRVCEGARGPSGEEAAACLSGFRSVLRGERESFRLEYPCHSPTEQRWFVLNATPLPDRSGLVVSHFDITEQRRVELAFQQLIAFLQ